MTSPFLNISQAAEYLAFVGLNGSIEIAAFRKFIAREQARRRQAGEHEIRIYKLGGRLRYHVDDIKALAIPQRRVSA
jgi:hypothetical protein